jgi:hypothetical protein
VQHVDCNDTVFCNGFEACIEGMCRSGQAPCSPELCIEDWRGCITPCIDDASCSDGIYCNGIESCDGGSCVAGAQPCYPNETCDEERDMCILE